MALLDFVIGKQKNFLNSMQPQQSNMYMVEFPRIVKDGGGLLASLGKGVAQVVAGAVGGTTGGIASSLIGPTTEIGSMCSNVSISGTNVELLPLSAPHLFELPKNTDQTTVSMTLWTSNNMKEYIAFSSWLDMVVNSSTKDVGFWEDYASGNDIIVTFVDKQLMPTIDIALRDCYPIALGDISLSYDSSDLLRFDITFAVRSSELNKHGFPQRIGGGLINRIAGGLASTIMGKVSFGDIKSTMASAKSSIKDNISKLF